MFDVQYTLLIIVTLPKINRMALIRSKPGLSLIVYGFFFVCAFFFLKKLFVHHEKTKNDFFLGA